MVPLGGCHRGGPVAAEKARTEGRDETGESEKDRLIHQPVFALQSQIIDNGQGTGTVGHHGVPSFSRFSNVESSNSKPTAIPVALGEHENTP